MSKKTNVEVNSYYHDNASNSNGGSSRGDLILAAHTIADAIMHAGACIENSLEMLDDDVRDLIDAVDELTARCDVDPNTETHESVDLYCKYCHDGDGADESEDEDAEETDKESDEESEYLNTVMGDIAGEVHDMDDWGQSILNDLASSVTELESSSKKNLSSLDALKKDITAMKNKIIGKRVIAKKK